LQPSSPKSGDREKECLSATQLMAAFETEVQFCASLRSKSKLRRRETLATGEREQKLERHLEEETAIKELKSVKQLHA
jgi:hypothetical protein